MLSLRAAQFIKLDGRAPNGEFLDPAYPSQIGETKTGSWHEASPIPWQHWWMTFLPPLQPRARVQYVQDLLIYPTISFTIICFCKECMKGDYNGFLLSGCWPAVTRCMSCTSVWQQQAGIWPLVQLGSNIASTINRLVVVPGSPGHLDKGFTYFIKGATFLWV